MKGANILITGGAGFIGSTVARTLMGANRLTLADNLHRNAMQYTLSGKTDQVDFINCDVTDRAAVEALVAQVKPTHIVHAAGIAGIDTVDKFPIRTLEVNMLGSAYMLEAASKVGGIERLVAFSTSEIFGNHALKPDQNTSASVGAVGEPRWVYATSKLASEHLAYAYFRERQLPTVSLRPFNVYGPGQVGEGALSIFVQRALRDEPITLYGDGSQIRSWCYVDDMVDGVLLALTKDTAPGKAFNIGDPRSTDTMLTLARRIIRLLNSRSEIRMAPSRSADIALRIPDIEYPRQVLGFEPKVELDEGIVRTAEFYRQISQATPVAAVRKA